MGNIICRGKNLGKQVLGGKQLGNKIGTLMTKHSKHMKEKKQVGDIDPNFVCHFCHEQVHLERSFNIKGCAHFYCQECIVRFIVSKLQDNVTSVTCPDQGCPGVLDLEYCRPILPYDVFHRWGKACEPDDTKQAQCPHCKGVFCVKCKVPWHTEFDCDLFQKPRDMGEDQQLEELAKNKNWRRCPSCKYYVERRDGCSYIKCRSVELLCYATSSCSMPPSTYINT
ncbi:unnamed protein product [Prunus armeniaca]|uniref:RBR-type E3 ubiquitin transferase n=1 Tax=Prunus armeniaca TaxID=36596 RepID=A0A6J5VIT2_PRUAR|nr:unnamed protein product [Prunus armeniaca]CAB4318442.1 unnamed protein product [Prunus armeniaca]